MVPLSVYRAFDLEWWYWLALSGMFIGCAFRYICVFKYLSECEKLCYCDPYSVKWVGLFVIALVGLTTIKDLWDLLGDLSVNMVSVSVCLSHSNIRAFRFMIK